LRFDFSVSEYTLFILKTLPVLILVKIIVFYCYGLFHSSLRYVSVFDLWQIIKANSIASVVFFLIIAFVNRMVGYPRSIFILDWGICLILISGFRLSGRLLREKKGFSAKLRNKKVIIVGAGEAGILVLKECQRNLDMNFHVVGFIDDNVAKGNLQIQGVKVLGGRKMIPEVVDKYQIEEIIIAIPSAEGKVIRNVLEYCQIKGVKIKIVPGIYKILSGDLEIKLRDVQPEDLLGREVVDIDEDEIKSYVEGKTVLVTGAGGSIGSELSKQIARFFPQKLILWDHNENDIYFLERELQDDYPNLSLKTIVGDIQDISLLKYTFSKLRPEIIFHAAAFKHVPLMEKNVAAAFRNNVIGSRNLMYAAEHYNAERFVLISTDKAVNPTSVMGATKRIVEMVLQAKAKSSRTKFMAVRFGNVLGSNGSVVPLFKKQIEEGGPITVTHPDAMRYFMSVHEAVRLVLQAGVIGKGGEIFILDMGEQIKIVDLARNLIALSGLKPEKDIAIKFTGLRPGEKLREETLHDAERDKVTKHNKIYITQPNNFDSQKLRSQIKELEELIKIRDERKIVKKIQEIVPSFTSSLQYNE
ncbi:MAG: nucleoside-diphosphate sugar epimerase/dehydratase, partial [Candidatus Kaelpia aquatica]|nr:nucleoside-diphosphate sugar epimerase/dehydratase [Candidatus Kaelpia aquatica]